MKGLIFYILYKYHIFEKSENRKSLTCKIFIGNNGCGDLILAEELLNSNIADFVFIRVVNFQHNHYTFTPIQDGRLFLFANYLQLAKIMNGLGKLKLLNIKVYVLHLIPVP